MRKDIKRQCENELRNYANDKCAEPWAKIIIELLAELLAEDKAKARLIELIYFKKHSLEKTCELLPCCDITARIWREDALGRLAAKAAYIKLIRP